MKATQKNILHERGMEFLMELTTCNIDGEDEMQYTTYGIRMTDPDGKALLHYRDISTSREYVEAFIQLCVDGGASPVHVASLLEDYLE